MKEVDLSQGKRSYINVMEGLVATEVAKQLQVVPANIRRYIKQEEVVTYALNRLPALYASSERGWEYQHQSAIQVMHQKIKDAVRQAIAAVQVDPIRVSQPLHVGQNRDAEAVLKSLRALFQLPDMDWATALQKLKGLDAQSLTSSSAEETVASQPQPAHHWQPGTYGTQTSRQHHRRVKPASRPEETPVSSSLPKSGWDNVFYRL